MLRLRLLLVLVLTTVLSSYGNAAPLVAQFIWQGEGTLNGQPAVSLFVLEQPFNSDDVVAGPTAGSWRWTAPVVSLPATISIAGGDLLTVTEDLSLTVDATSVRLTSASGLGIGYFGSLGSYDLKSTKATMSLATDPFGNQTFPTDQGPFVGFNRGNTAFGVGIADSVAGDYSGNGVVDAADYPVWRDHLGANQLLNRSPLISGPVGSEDYEFWKSQLTGPIAAIFGTPVPEPHSLVVCAGIVMVFLLRFLGYPARRERFET